MLQNVLVPLDGSRISEEVMSPVVKLLRSTGGRLVLFHAVTPSEYFSVTATQYVDQERRRSAEYLLELAERAGREGIGVQERIVTGEASREIVSEARRSHADLIAMSSHGRSGIREWAFGSIAERVLRTTNVPVLVFRGNVGRAYNPRRIVIALDGSEDSLEVVAPAAELAFAFKGSVTLVHAGKQAPPSLPLAEKILHRRGVPFQVRLVAGDEPAAAILAAAEDEKADLLALTTTGKSRRAGIFFGSVAEELLKKSGRPLLVVHTGRTD
jgi:nucleotide-binding universal stress UspA family protein